MVLLMGKGSHLPPLDFIQDFKDQGIQIRNFKIQDVNIGVGSKDTVCCIEPRR